jgi:hypothetical protein
MPAKTVLDTAPRAEMAEHRGRENHQATEGGKIRSDHDQNLRQLCVRRLIHPVCGRTSVSAYLAWPYY